MLKKGRYVTQNVRVRNPLHVRICPPTPVIILGLTFYHNVMRWKFSKSFLDFVFWDELRSGDFLLIFSSNTSKIWIFDLEILIRNKSEFHVRTITYFVVTTSFFGYFCHPISWSRLQKCSRSSLWLTPSSIKKEVRIRIVLSKEQIWLLPKSEFNFN